ncbi:LamG-like jellyroll fold domain-containing protein [Streptomyces halstedii]|uniref:LamG domain-containing protein n=1 Tax=Streptomyces halstedii TaxID=1944 RepID=A0A6N9U1V3_STRHA|nr:LamG-like jellyroll fold domain-containing protein [Streptomyces halstedii]NEA15866.1 LamG domain-containing protein [Streptomyces halstedii]
MAAALLGSAVPVIGAEATPAVADDAAPSVAADRTPEARASALAAKTGERVVVDEATTQSSEVFANPDGTFTQEMNAAPVRARQGDGAWAPIDSTLVREADGSVRAKNTTVGLTFSGGGSGDGLVTLEDKGHELQLGWPTALPEPRLDGNTATYAGVLPDVDLKLTALSSGYTSVLVVKTAEAAGNPALSKIDMTVSSGGLGIAPTADGGFVARDGDGTPVFESPAGRMWDSAGDTPASAPATTRSASTASSTEAEAEAKNEPQAVQTAPLPAAGGEPDPEEGPGSGDAAAKLPLKVTGTGLEITPDPALLRGEDTVFPLYIDPPTKGITRGDWTALASNGTKYWEFDGDKGVGRCSNYAGYLCSSSPYTQRMYFEYPLSSIHGKKVLDATFEAYQVWTFTCDRHWYDLSRVDKGISSSTTWSSRPTGVDLMGDRHVAYGRGGLCSPSQPANWVRFSDNLEETNENLTPTLASYAAKKTSQITFSLTAHDESNAASWARFRKDAKLSVTYVSNPDKPTSHGVQQGTTGRACNAATAPFVTSVTTPKMLATVQSSDGSNAQLRALFEVWKADGSSRAWYAASPDGAWVADNAARTASSSKLPAQTDYRMRVKTQAYYKTDRGATGVLDSAWSSWCYFRVDTDSPPPPVVTSADGLYKPAETDPAAGGVGTSGKFTFTPADTDPAMAGIQSDVVSYKWKLNSGAVSAPISVAKGTATTQTITPNQAGENTVQVWGYDAAGHSSLTSYYSFLVKGAEKPSGIWHLDNSLTDATSATPHPLTSSGATWDALARSGSAAAKFNGTSAYLSTNGAVLDTTKSFTVSAWARLTKKDVNYTVLSQAGTNASGFQLYYSTAYNAWIFNRHQTDVAAPAITRSIGAKQPVLNAWTHLAGVYNAAAQTIQLYVNGVPQGSPVPFKVTPWKASGGLQVGRLWISATGKENFAGTIDEVKVWSRALADTEVAHDAWLEDEDLGDGTAGDPVPALVAKWDATDMANATGTTVKDTSGFGRNLTLNGAALTQFTTGDPDIGEEVTTTQTMALNGTSAHATATGPVVDDSGSFTATAWVTLDPAKLADTSKSYAVQVFGQSGASQSSWGVWYEQPAGSTQGRWTFGRPDKDGTGAVWTKSESTALTTAQLGVPVMLTVVHDAQAAADPDDTSKFGALKLYVDSARMGDEDGVSYSAPWQAAGAFEIGRAKINSAAARYFPGTIDSVRVWAGATSTDTIANRYNIEQR